MPLRSLPTLRFPHPFPCCHLGPKCIRAFSSGGTSGASAVPGDSRSGLGPAVPGVSSSGLGPSPPPSGLGALGPADADAPKELADAGEHEGSTNDKPGVACCPSLCPFGLASVDVPSDKKEIGEERSYGIPWTPKQFVEKACHAKHPRELLQCVPQALKESIDHQVQSSQADLARERTESMRKWVLRAKELREAGEDLPMNTRCREILGSKSLKLFEEMLLESGYGDCHLARDIASGFELLGTMPSSGVMPKKTVVATVGIEQLREVAHLNQKATWASVAASGSSPDPDGVLNEIYKLTQEECAKGWMKGPFTLDDIPHDAALTPRFGVVQSSHDAKLGTVSKVRPIDNFTASLANLTNSGDETIMPQGVDMVVAAMIYRVRAMKRLGKDPDLRARAIDLRKAYKQLPLSDNALKDSFVCVYNPASGQPEIFQCLVLPFGAKPSVMAFCRTSSALWFIGLRVFRFHWTIYFDDFILVCAALEAKHLDLMQASFFALLSWGGFRGEGRRVLFGSSCTWCRD